MENNWIMCEDRLPENNQEVLVTIKAGTPYQGSEGADLNEVEQAIFCEAGTEFWYPCFFLAVSDEPIVEGVIAWMPLPEPYMEEE